MASSYRESTMTLHTEDKATILQVEEKELPENHFADFCKVVSDNATAWENYATGDEH